MAMQRFTIKLTQLRCILESDPGPSEPYIWVTYFALGPQIPQFQTGPLALNTPSYDAFRTEFADNVSAGSVVGIPPFIASASFDMDLTTAGPKLLGCVAVLMEEDDTRQSDIVFGRIAYTKEMEKQLNALMQKRIQTGDRGPLTDAEKNAIKAAVTSKVVDAVGSHQGIFDIFRDQDDNLGFTHQVFPEAGDTIHATTFDFPEIVTTRTVNLGPGFPPQTIVTDRYVLSGAVTVGAVPPDPVDFCARQRAALEAKRQQIKGLETRVTLLQQQLQTATPQQKSAIVQQIKATNAEITQAEAQLPALEAALKKCEDSPHIHVDPQDGGGVKIG
jgi:hypothetical protein